MKAMKMRLFVVMTLAGCLSLAGTAVADQCHRLHDRNRCLRVHARSYADDAATRDAANGVCDRMHTGVQSTTSGRRARRDKHGVLPTRCRRV